MQKGFLIRRRTVPPPLVAPVDGHFFAFVVLGRGDCFLKSDAVFVCIFWYYFLCVFDAVTGTLLVHYVISDAPGIGQKAIYIGRCYPSLAQL